MDISELLSCLIHFGFLLSSDRTECNCVHIDEHPAWTKLSQTECGDSVADRIIGGNKAALGQFPWIVRLGYTVGDDPNLEWMCGGALVSDRHVLTAGHCVAHSKEDQVKLVVVRLGEHNTETDSDCELSVCAPAVQDRAPKVVKPHYSFDKPAFHNDIALIEFDPPANLTDYVVPICLPRGNQTSGLKVGEMTVVAGWGMTNMTTQRKADILQFVSLPIVSPDLCNEIGFGFKTQKSEICAGARTNKDACAGDSGGPLMKVFDTPEGPKHYLIGIVSFGPNICGIKKPGVYTSVPYFLKWILDNII